MILFLNHQEPRCGVYQMGKRIGQTLGGMVRYCEGVDAARRGAADGPSAVVYNWHGDTLPWAPEIISRCPRARHIGLMHEISPQTSHVDAGMFSARVVCDPLFPVNNRSLFRCVRHVPRREGALIVNERFTVGSFGFAVGGKAFAAIVRLSSLSFPGCLVRLHISRARYGDDAGVLALASADQARAAAENGAEVQVSHDFMGDVELVDWLAGNDVNVFFYDPNPGRGVSSALDYAIAAQRPIVVNDSQMFRHVRERLGYYPDRDFKYLAGSTGPIVESIYQEWTPDRLCADFAHVFRRLGVS